MSTSAASRPSRRWATKRPHPVHVHTYPDPEVAIFHELAHQVAYAKDDNVFNESFAVAVEQEGRALARCPDDPALAAQVESASATARLSCARRHARARLVAVHERANRCGEARREGGGVRGYARRLRASKTIRWQRYTMHGSRRGLPTPASPGRHSTREKCCSSRRCWPRKGRPAAFL